ncbi:hypothetical protein FACS1894181_19050 [Bacteroidia bacterium]|nr:hypothetical protein FACS1894181_19050 [Bacteroidia bacterium]
MMKEQLRIAALCQKIGLAVESIKALETYGNVPNFSLYGETSSITHALTDFNKPENQVKVTLIPGLSAYIDELKDVNDELNRLYNQRLDEAEEIKELGKLTDYLPLVDKQLITLFHALNMVYGYNERTAKLPALKATIERIAKKAKALLDQLKKVLEHRHIKTGGTQTPDITNPEVPGTDTPGPENPGEDGDGEGGDGGETPGGNTENPDIENPPLPPLPPRL